MSFEKLMPYEAATLVVEAYMSYYSQYRRITKRARIRFEQKDWHGIQADSRARIDLYRDRVGETTKKLFDFLGDRATNHYFWLQTKVHYAQEIANFNTRNIAESFYNSVFRHAHHGQLGKDDRLMFVQSRGNYRDFKSRIPIIHTLPIVGSLDLSMQYLLQYYHFDAEYEDLSRDIDYLTRRLSEWIEENAVPEFPLQLQVLKSVFYRNKAAYIVGRLIQHGSPVPFVIPILNGPNGLVIDALLLHEDEISTIFSYNRSYFLVDVDIVTEVVDFLQSVMPNKNISELYNSIGFEKHGKTVFYREFERHLARSTDDFAFPSGIKGMVMTVFTLPSFPVVFKVIKDRFVPPKQVTYDQVVSAYELINRHDRVGRMSDSYLFQQLTLPVHRIDAEVLMELQEDCASRIEFRDENQVIIKHAYIEKRMIPLDVYLSRATPLQAREVINEYGKAIKEMAATNIFPGDMLLKNFGVTRLNRVVFYDYDEIGFITDYNFRRIPPPRDPWEEMAAEPYYHVGANDVFPEEFPNFLIANPIHRRFLEELHGDLFTAEFWQKVQKIHKDGRLPTVYPYRRRQAFRHLYGGEPREPYFEDAY